MSGNVCGYVVRNESPVADAAVTIVEGPSGHIDLSPVSDADGWFALDDLAAGRWVLRALAPDGGTGEADVVVWDDSLSDVTLVLGEPSPGEPEARPETEHGEQAVEPDAGSDDVPGSDRRRTPSGPVLALPGQRKRPGSGSIRGRVTDAVSGEPVSGAVVVVTDGPGPLPDVAVTTDAHGVFAIGDMESGEWSLRVDTDDRRTSEVLVAVLSGRPVDIAVVVAE